MPKVRDDMTSSNEVGSHSQLENIMYIKFSSHASSTVIMDIFNK